MLRSLAIVFSAGAFAVACSGDGTGEPSPGSGVAVGPQRPPSNPEAPAFNPQSPTGNENAPPGNAEAPPPNPQQPPPPEGSGSVGPPSTGGGSVVDQCRRRCEDIIDDCGNGCQGVCRGLRSILEACQAEVQAFFTCFADVGVDCNDGEVSLPATECVSRLGQAGQLSQRCLTALLDE